MTRLKKYFNTKGLTLIEILVSVVILGIILTAFFSFFSQSMMFSSKVEDQFSAVNVGERLLYEVKKDLSKSDLSVQSCSNVTLTPISGEKISVLKKDSSGDYYYEINNKKYYPFITTCQNSDEADLGLYRVHIKLSDRTNWDHPLSEVFNYIQ